MPESENQRTEVSPEREGKRKLTGPAAWIARIMAVAITTFVVLYLLHIFQLANIFIYPVSYRAGVAGLFLALIFLQIPATRKAARGLPWYDILFAILILIGCGYVFFFYDDILMHGGLATPFEQVMGVIVILLVLEATRRTNSFIVVLIFAAFLLYPVFSNYLPGPLHGRQQDLSRLIGYIYLYEDGIFGIIMRVITTIVIPFVLFGQFLDTAGAGKFFVDLSYAVMGRFRGGPAKIAVLASACVGTITGSASGNVATTGVITIPLMKKVGYNPAFAGAVEAVASNGGALAPPVMGATAFIMSELTEIPYSAICVAAALPAALYFLSIFLQVDGEAAALELKGLPREELPSVRKTLARGWHYLVPIGVLLYVLIVLRYHPVMSAFYSIAALIIVSSFRRETRLKPRDILTALEQTSKKMVPSMGIITGAGIIVASVGLTGLGVRISQMLISLSGGELMLLLVLAAAANYVMGMGLPGSASYILLAVLVAPALEQMGLSTIAAHMFIFYTAMWAHITPPVAPDAFVAAGIAEADPLRVGMISMRLAVVAYLIPFMFAYNPGLLLIGELGPVIFSAVKAVIAILALAAGIEGYCYFAGKMNPYQRTLFVVSGLGLISPGLVLDFIGVTAGIVGFIWAKASIPKAVKVLERI